MTARKPSTSKKQIEKTAAKQQVKKTASKKQVNKTAAKKPAATKQVNKTAAKKSASTKTAAKKSASKTTAATKQVNKSAATKSASKTTAATKQVNKSAATKSASKTTAATKSASKTTAATKQVKKTVAKKSASKQTAAKKSPAKKPTAQQPASNQTAAKKSPAKKSPAQQPASNQTAAKKSPAQQPASEKTPAKKPPAKPPEPRPALPPPARLTADDRRRLQALLAEADAALTLSDEGAAHAGGDEQRERYADDSWTMGTMWSPQLWSACGEFVARLEQLAETPPRSTSEFTGIQAASAFFVDTADLTTLWFAPSPKMPAVLFVPVAADVASIRAVLAEYSGQRARSEHVRAFMGFGSQLRIPNVYSGELGEVDDHELDRFFVFSPVASTLSRRTYFSASKFSFELHGDDLFIWDLAYPPCTTSAPALARFKAITGYDFPRDMPVDLAAAVEGFEFATADELAARISGEPQFTPAILTVIAAIGWRSLATVERLRRYLDRPTDVQVSIVNAAFRYGWERLAWDVLRAAADDKLQGQIADAIADHEFTALPAAAGLRRVLPPDAELSALHDLAAARGWTALAIPDNSPHVRALYGLPARADLPPGRVAWLDIPTLALATLALEYADAELPALSAAFPDAPATDPWRTAAANAWLGDVAPTLEHLRAALASPAWPDRLSAARLIGQADITAAKDLVHAALAAEPHDQARKALAAARDHLA